MRILVTGGAGYIGSHTVLELLAAGYDVTAADDFVNSKPTAITRLNELASKPFRFVECDFTRVDQTDALFSSETFDAVIHFDQTSAVEPLERTSLWDAGEPPETFPTGL